MNLRIKPAIFLLSGFALFLFTCTESPIQGKNDHNGPVISITSTVPEKSVSPEITINGKITDENGIDSVILNSNSTKHGIIVKGDSFSVDVALAYGVNVIGVFAMDNSANHNVSSDTIFITREQENKTEGLVLSITEPQAGNIANAPWEKDSICIRQEATITLNLKVDSLFYKYKITELKLFKIPSTGTSLSTAQSLFSSSSYTQYIRNISPSGYSINISDTVKINKDYSYALKYVFKDSAINHSIEQYMEPFHYRFYSRNLSTIEIDSTNDSVAFKIVDDTSSSGNIKYCFFSTNLTPLKTDSFFLKAIPDLKYRNGRTLGLASIVSTDFSSKYGILVDSLFEYDSWTRNKSNIPFSYGKYYKLYVMSVNYYGDYVVDSVLIKGPSKITDSRLLFSKNSAPSNTLFFSDTISRLKKEFNPHYIDFTDKDNIPKSLTVDSGSIIEYLSIDNPYLSLSLSGNGHTILGDCILKSFIASNANLTAITGSRNFSEIKLHSDILIFSYCNISPSSPDTMAMVYYSCKPDSIHFDNCFIDRLYLQTDEVIYNSLPRLRCLNSSFSNCVFIVGNLGFRNSTMHNSNISCISNFVSNSSIDNSVIEAHDTTAWGNIISDGSTIKNTVIYSANLEVDMSHLENPFLHNSHVTISKSDIILTKWADTLYHFIVFPSGERGNDWTVTESKIFSQSDTLVYFYGHPNAGLILKNNLIQFMGTGTLMYGYRSLYWGNLILDSNIIKNCSKLGTMPCSVYPFCTISNNAFYGTDSLSFIIESPKLVLNHNTFYPNNYFDISGKIDTLISTNNIFNTSSFSGTFKSINISNCNFPIQPTFPTTNCIFGDPMIDIQDDGIFLETGSQCIGKASDGKNIGSDY